MINIHEILRIVRVVREIYQPGSEYPDAAKLSMSVVYKDIEDVKNILNNMKLVHTYSRGIGNINNISEYEISMLTEQALVKKIEGIMVEIERNNR